MSNRPSNSPQSQRIGDYTIIRVLGEGGMGKVYLAEDATLGRKVALKTMRSEYATDKSVRERFLREARAAAGLDHDHIVPILSIGETAEGVPYIVMPFLKGESLADRLNREPVADVGLILKVAREVAEGLVVAHQAGLVHRDIKPANIWLEGDGDSIRRCKVLDFGLARRTDDTQLTDTGKGLGSPAYMAPEQARNAKEVDHRADLFSLGATLYRMATSRLPFAGENAFEVLAGLISDTPKPVRELAPQLPPELASLIDRLLCKDRAGRPQTAAEVVAVVCHLITPPKLESTTLPARLTDSRRNSQPQQLLADETKPAHPSTQETTPGLVPRTPRRSRRKVWICLFFGLLTGSLAIAGSWWLWNYWHKSTGFTDELRYMPKGCQFVVSIDVQTVLKSKVGSEFLKSDSYKQLNKMVAQANKGADLEQLVQESSGLKYGDVRRLTLFGLYFDEERGEPHVLVVIKTENAKKFKPGRAFSGNSLIEEKVGNFTVFANNRMGYCVVDDTTIVLGQVKLLREVLRRDGKPEISKTLQAAMTEADFSNPIAAAFDLKDVVAEFQKNERRRFDRYNDVNAPNLTPGERADRQFYAELEKSYQSETAGLFDWYDGAAFRMTLGTTIEAKATVLLKPELGGSPNVSMQIDHKVVLKIVQDGIEFAGAEERRTKRMSEHWEKRDALRKK